MVQRFYVGLIFLGVFLLSGHSSAYAGGGAVNHEKVTIKQLMSEAPALEGDADRLGVKAVAVILFFRRYNIWDGGLAMTHNKLYPELFRTVLLPKDTYFKMLYSEEMMKRWAKWFNYTEAFAELFRVLTLEEDQKRKLNDVVTKFVQGCDIEMRGRLYADGRDGSKLDADFWQKYWVGVAHGLWTAAAVEVDCILTEDQKKEFDAQLEKWREANKGLLEEHLEKD